MQKTILAALAVLASVSVASATDLPSKKTTPAAPAAATSADSNYYVGVNAGTVGSSTNVYSGGVVAGWNAMPFLAVEGAYNYNFVRDDSGKNNHTVSINALPQYRVSFIPVTAYALIGTGYRFSASSNGNDHTVYNYGGGLKYSLTNSIEVDARYTRTTAYDTVKYSGNEDRVTLGLNYKF